jgi:hypothetical protein
MRWVSTLVALLACTTDAIELRPEADALTLGPEIPVPERSVRPLSNHIRRLIPGGLDVPLTKTVARKDMNFLKFLSHEAVSNSLGPIEKNSLPRATLLISFPAASPPQVNATKFMHTVQRLEGTIINTTKPRQGLDELVKDSNTHKKFKLTSRSDR